MKKQNNISTGISFLEKVLKITKNYSFMEIIKAIVVIMFMGYTTIFMFNPEYLFRKYDETKAKEHSENLKHRINNSVVIKTELENLLHNTGADRAFLIEFHNSIKSVEGFPYAYGSMNYEVVRDSIGYISDEYTNFSLTKYDFIPYMLKNNLFVGDIESMKSIDNRLYYKFLSNGMNELAVIVIEGVDLPLGILGLSYSNSSIENQQDIKAILRKEALKISLHSTKQ